MPPLAYNSFRDRLQQQYLRLEQNIRLKMMPAFGGIDDELSQYFTELDGQTFASDEPSFQEGEYKAELSALFEDQLRASQCDMAAFAVAALYHHWERSVKWLIARKHHPDQVKGLKNADFGELKKKLDFELLTPECQVTFQIIDLGRLIANVIKHGDGSSAAELLAKAPELFERPWQDEHFDLPSGHGVNLIWVRPEIVDTIAGAVHAFWETLPDRSFPPSRPFTLEAMLNGDLD